MQGTLVKVGRVGASVVALVALTTFPDDTAALLRRAADVISGADFILWIVVAAFSAGILRDFYTFWRDWRAGPRQKALPSKEWEVVSYWGETGDPREKLALAITWRKPPIHTMRNTRTGEVREFSYPGGPLTDKD